MDMNDCQPIPAAPVGNSNAPKPKKKKAFPGGQTFTCKTCNYTCKKGIHLKLHIDRKHKKLTPYHCNMCDYKTAYKSQINIHISTHFGATPKKCNACDYRCADKRTLKVHRENDPHFCDNCDFNCNSANELIQHKTVHSEKRTIQCFLCEFVASTRREYNLHQQVHKGEKYKCNICSCEFEIEKSLKKHLRKKHGQC